MQVVVGPIADQLASEIRAGLRQPSATATATAAPAAEPRASSRSEVTRPADPAQIAAALAALGGKSNIAGLHLSSSRLCVAVRDPAAVNESALAKAVRAVARPAPDTRPPRDRSRGRIVVRRHDGFLSRNDSRHFLWPCDGQIAQARAWLEILAQRVRLPRRHDVCHRRRMTRHTFKRISTLLNSRARDAG